MLGFLDAPVFFLLGGTGLAGLPLHVHRTWATEVCLSQDTPIGRRSVEHHLRSLVGVHCVPL